MRMRLAIISLFMAVALMGVAQLPRYREYIHKYRELAIDQMRRHKIPASITMAQGLLETGAGTSALARRGHNHFGIKAHNDWTGPVMLVNDDAPNEKFRVYARDEDSFEDHSLFLLRGRRYAGLFRLSITDYKGWAYGLKAAGYATSPTYAARLIRIIEDYQLADLDEEALSKRHRSHKYAESVEDISHYPVEVQDALTRGTHTVGYNNRNYYIVARQGDTFRSIAQEYGVSARKLRRYNEVDRHHELKAGDIVYFEKKRARADKVYRKKYHQIQQGESLYMVAQRYGVRLKSLYKINHFDPDHAVSVGERIRIR